MITPAVTAQKRYLVSKDRSNGNADRDMRKVRTALSRQAPVTSLTEATATSISTATGAGAPRPLVWHPPIDQAERGTGSYLPVNPIR